MATEPTRATSQLSYALYYAQKQQWPVLPIFEIEGGCCTCAAGKKCARPGKHPRIRNGVHDATTDPDQIRAWWHKWPNANIGVATGRISNIVVLDVDPRNGAKNAFNRLRKQLGPLRPTIKARSGGSGWHYIYAYPNFTVRSDTGKQKKQLGSGWDVLSDGSYFIAPHSTHLSGKKYAWFAGRSPNKMGLRGIEWVIFGAEGPINRCIA